MSVKQKKATSLFPMDNNKKDRILTKFFYIVFQILKVLLIKICKIQPLDLLFLVVFISFYIIRYHFSQVFRTSFNIIWKKDFFTNFPFLTDSLTPPPPTQPLPPAHPLNSQNSLSVTNVFCQYSLTYHGFSRLLCYDVTRTAEQN